MTEKHNTKTIEDLAEVLHSDLPEDGYDDEFPDYSGTKYREAKQTLEEKYAERGLAFDDNGFMDNIPTQAFGWVDGYRFYFRLRGGSAVLRVGERDIQAAERRRDEEIARLEADLERKRAEGAEEDSMYTLLTRVMLDQRRRETFAVDDQDIPDHVFYRAACEYGDWLNASLGSNENTVDLFSRLMESLEPVVDEPADDDSANNASNEDIGDSENTGDDEG